ncbi:MAG: hypothetical protein HON90_05900 [Halobacteriovoraceae bacterium]|jgi:hypothetical protein|nr:hypothetical protein [Halobacteriovoraceae bacterium]
MSCPKVSKKDYQSIKEEIKNGKSDKNLAAIPSKKEIDELITTQRNGIKRLVFPFFLGINAYFLNRIHHEADEQSTKNLVYASMIGTFATMYYDYENIFNDEDPPWVDFSVIPTEISKSIVPMSTVTFRF